MAKRTGAIDLTKGNPYKLYLQFMLPLLVGNILQQFYNIVDTIVVGNVLGDTSLAAVGSGFPFLFLLTSLFIGLGMGAMIVVAQLAGQKDEENLQKLLGTIYRLLIFGAVPMSILGVVFAKPVLIILQVRDPATLTQAALYLQIVFLGLLGTFGFNVNAGFLQGLGDSMSSLLFLAISTVINIVLDLFLTMVIPLGVMGVAIATTFAQTFSWIFGIFYINRRYHYLHINLCKLPFDRTLMLRSFKLGLPAAIQNLIYAIGNMVIQALVNRNGVDFTAGFVAANKVDTFVFLPLLSMATAVTTFVGQNVGHGNAQRVHAGKRAGLRLITLSSLLIGGFVYLLREPAIALFNQDPGVIRSGVYYLQAVLPFYFILGLFYVFNSMFQGAGQTYLPMVASAFAFCFARVPIAFILNACFGSAALYYAYPLSWAVGLLISFTYSKSLRWRQYLDNAIAEHRENQFS